MDAMLERLINAFGVSGREEQIKKVIIDELKDIKYDIKEDKMGNLIVKMGEGSEKIMITANMDQAGLIATHIEDNGFVRVSNIGDIKPSNINHSLVAFESGIVGRIAGSKENPKIENLFVDFALSDKEEVCKKVKIGDAACLLASGFEVENKVVVPGLNNRIGCYILLKVIKELEKSNKEVYFVFSAQGELGGRGARAAAYAINPDYCVVLDVNEAGDYIGGEGNIKLECGPVIRIKDRTLIISQEIKEILDSAAEKANVKIQYGICKEGTDGGLIHKERGGIRTGVLAVPIRYNHTVSEMVSMKDVENIIKVIKELL